MPSRFELAMVASIPMVLGCRSASPRPAQGPDEAARSTLERWIADREAPGVQYAFLDEQGVVFAAQVGMADLEKAVPVGPDTLFHGYSVTKTFTAAAIVRLSLEHKVDLDQPIARYLPELGDTGAPTLRQVLAHVGGYPNPIPLGWSHVRGAAFDEAGFVQRIAREYGKPERAPGESFEYSNVGYLLLGEVVHRVSGRPYTRYVEEELIAPLGLRSGAQLRFSLSEPAAHARGYIARWSGLNLVLGFFIDRDTFISGTHDGWTQLADQQVDGPAYGGLIGNAAGFARYLQALLREEAPFSAEVTKLLFTQQKTSRGEEIPMALSWFMGEVGGEPYFDHAGGGGGYSCELRVYPRKRRASLVLLNRTGVKNDHLLDQIDPFLLNANARGSPGPRQ